jgi:hypothetical protein
MLWLADGHVWKHVSARWKFYQASPIASSFFSFVYSSALDKMSSAGAVTLRGQSTPLAVAGCTRWCQQCSERDTYLADSLTTVLSDPDLYRLLTIHVPNLTFLFRRLGRTTDKSIELRVFARCFVTWNCLRRGVVSALPNSQAGEPPLVGCPRLFIQCIRSYTP